MLFYYLLPPLVLILKNLWIALILGIPLAWACINPALVWNVSKQLSWNLTKFLISKDKIGFMWRYHQYLADQLDKLSNSLNQVTAAKEQLIRAIANLQSDVDQKSRQAEQAEKTGRTQLMREIAAQLRIDTQQLENLRPQLENVTKQESYLSELLAHLTSQAKDLRYTLQSKEREYDLMKKTAIATGNAAEFLSDNNEQYRSYQESLKQIEQSITLDAANIGNFQKKAEPLLAQFSLEKSMNEEEGLKLLEGLKQKSANLRLATR